MRCMNDQGEPVLYAIVTGSPAARDVGKLVALAQADGWDVCVVASPDGRRFIDTEQLAAQTGHIVRSQYKEPGTGESYLDLFPWETAWRALLDHPARTAGNR